MSRPGLSVVKIGGSLLADRARLAATLASLASGAEGTCIAVPGGGPFADAVRGAQAALGFGDALAHRLALDAMGHVAEVLCALEPRLARHTDPAALQRLAASGRVPVWDPAALRAGHPAVAETWTVTSDSLALWLAAETRAARCVLVKAAPCPPGASPADLAASGLVDAAFPAFAARFSGEIVLRCAEADLRLGRQAA
ncbi:uridylate kinase [Methylobacterium nigriterrae]|uniref:amino acid kinase family protein n=1 Tax=Methylobacterium nigriterrae TaxID=3127512 RepID=UPI003013EFC9